MFEAVTTFNIKTRNSCVFLMQYTDDNGLPVDLTDYQVTSQVRNAKDRKITDMTINRVNNTLGQFTVSLPDDVVLPVGTLYLDVFFENGTAEVNSDTIKLNVKAVVTHG
ncbi:hypothetical protein KZX29_04255 [Moraxella osloensis]|uniref:BppU family phage baseplate upper protein n=1 Tax=Faucicola osloensis TaxID=34062 RepID=UPI0020036103|nr:BppU family phage baseplate upper protein [Moraxella osloensis]MCK6158009.1 hypothetical protein [Moraxella osloensis]